MPIYLVIFLIVNVFLTYNSHAAINIPCPETLTTEQLNQLSQVEQIVYNDKTFILDGTSKKIINRVDLKLEVKKPYQQNANGKVSCWYHTNIGHLGIREK